MKKTLFMLVLLVAPAAVAQPASHYTQNAFYFEVLGQGLLYSVNFDHRFTENIAARVGFSSFIIEFISDVSIITIPLMVEYLSGHGDSHLEVGLGIVPIHGSLSTSFFGTTEGSVGAWAVIGTATLGYRYQPRTEGLLFRIGVTPLFDSRAAQIWGGLSLGYAF